jgi:hypothetical protein
VSKRIFILVFFFLNAIIASAQEWQWSVTVDSVLSSTGILMDTTQMQTGKGRGGRAAQYDRRWHTGTS